MLLLGSLACFWLRTLQESGGSVYRIKPRFFDFIGMPGAHYMFKFKPCSSPVTSPKHHIRMFGYANIEDCKKHGHNINEQDSEASPKIPDLQLH